MSHSNKFIDLTGNTFGYWLVLSFDCIKYRKTMWRCRCACGEERSVDGLALRKGRSTSCGCHSKDYMKASPIATRHGLKNKNPRLYGIWQNMLNRCRNKNVARYKSYGARGIAVCEEWKQYPPFFYWAMSNGYQDNLTIDRIDVDGNYEPSNCQWITMADNIRKAYEDRRRKKNGIQSIGQ